MVTIRFFLSFLQGNTYDFSQFSKTDINNLLFQDDLKSVVARKETGPVSDSDDCYYGIGCGEYAITDNTNKVP